jgi:hypothetical protein
VCQIHVPHAQSEPSTPAVDSGPAYQLGR